MNMWSEKEVDNITFNTALYKLNMFLCSCDISSELDTPEGKIVITKQEKNALLQEFMHTKYYEIVRKILEVLKNTDIERNFKK